MTHWAVSDVEKSQLLEFVQLLQNQSPTTLQR
jgi:hypothetical protein